MLKNSARNSRCLSSPNRLITISFTNDKSQLEISGPIRLFRDSLPSVPGACSVKHAGSKYGAFGSPFQMTRLHPGTTSTRSEQLPRTIEFERQLLSTTENGRPELRR